jgi:CRP-like cAMP-binding protein
LSVFFDYPESDLPEATVRETVLADRSLRDWQRLLEHTDRRRFTRGDVVVREGDAERALWIVSRGMLEVVVGRPGREQVVATVPARSVFGEIGFLDGEPRSATVRAASDGEAYRLTYAAFESLAARQPELARALLFDLARIVCARLRHMNELVARLST